MVGRLSDRGCQASAVECSQEEELAPLNHVAGIGEPVGHVAFQPNQSVLQGASPVIATKGKLVPGADATPEHVDRLLAQYRTCDGTR